MLQDLTARKKLQINNVGEVLNKVLQDIVALNDEFIPMFAFCKTTGGRNYKQANLTELSIYLFQFITFRLLID